CNNGQLARLDEYARRLLEPLLEWNGAGPVRFRAGLDLHRWCLKVAFNGERASRGPNRHLYSPLIPFVLGADQPQGPIDLLIALVPPVRSTPAERRGGAGPLLDVRLDRIGHQDMFGPDVFSPVISIGPAILLLLVWAVGTPRSSRRRPVTLAQRAMRF